jgi:GNAT superfamily N-acetyltransferase
MNLLQIRKAEVEDSTQISALMEELGYSLTPAEVAARIEVYHRSADAALVADDSGEVVGFVSFHIIPLFHISSSLGRITAMCIRSTRQREGIGRALLTRLDKIASSRGCVRIEVTSGDHRADDAHLFYQACGYALDSRRFQKILNQGEPE